MNRKPGQEEPPFEHPFSQLGFFEMDKCFMYSEKKIEQEARRGKPSSEHKHEPKWLPGISHTAMKPAPHVGTGVCKHKKNRDMVAV